MRNIHKNKNSTGKGNIPFSFPALLFFKYLLNHELINENPLNEIESPKYKKTIPSYVFETKLNELLEVSYGKDKRLVARNKLIIHLLFDSGVRVSELINIRVLDIDFNERSIKVFGKGSKDRYVFFSKKSLIKMEEWLMYHKELSLGEYLFVNYKGEQLSVRSVEKIIKCMGKKIGIDIHPHMLRHTFATDLLNKGADLRMIQELLGHENLDTTQIYTHVSNSKIKEVYDYSHNDKK